jgi:uncharacterized repeat protein (TIGR01451 family)
MKKYFALLSTIPILLSLFAVTPVYAGSNCQFIYGGGMSCGSGKLLVEKQVLQPGTASTYVNNLNIKDPHYQPSSPIFFRIIIRNVSNTTLNNINVLDTFDDSRNFIDFTDGPGNYDKTSKTLEYKIASLAPGQQTMVTIAGKVIASQNFPKGQPLVCVTNTVEASPVNDSPTEATTEFCIDTTIKEAAAKTQATTKGGLPVSNQTNNFPVYSPTPTQKTPNTGPETLPLLALLPTGALGFWLRKKAK